MITRTGRDDYAHWQCTFTLFFKQHSIKKHPKYRPLTMQMNICNILSSRKDRNVMVYFEEYKDYKQLSIFIIKE